MKIKFEKESFLSEVRLTETRRLKLHLKNGAIIESHYTEIDPSTEIINTSVRFFKEVKFTDIEEFEKPMGPTYSLSGKTKPFVKEDFIKEVKKVDMRKFKFKLKDGHLIFTDYLEIHAYDNMIYTPIQGYTNINFQDIISYQIFEIEKNVIPLDIEQEIENILIKHPYYTKWNDEVRLDMFNSCKDYLQNGSPNGKELESFLKWREIKRHEDVALKTFSIIDIVNGK